MASGKILHFLTTRFNIQVTDLPEVSAEWSLHRWNLFERYCLPSVEHQSCQGFRWLVYINPNTPELVLEKLKNTAERCFFLELITIPDDVAMKAHFISTVRQRSSLPSENAQWLITSRLDSDDALGKDFIGKLQVTCNTENKRIVANFKNGLILNPNQQNITFKTNQTSNPFISLIEKPSKEVSTILHQQHLKWETDPDYTELYTPEPQWLQVIHDKNVLNKISGKPHSYSTFKEQFGIKQPVYQTNHAALAYWEKLKTLLKKGS